MDDMSFLRKIISAGARAAIATKACKKKWGF